MSAVFLHQSRQRHCCDYADYPESYQYLGKGEAWFNGSFFGGAKWLSACANTAYGA